MKTRTRRRFLPAVLTSLIAPTGCGVGGDVPATGSQAVLPPTYKAREKEIADGFRAQAKKPSARPGSH